MWYLCRFLLDWCLSTKTVADIWKGVSAVLEEYKLAQPEVESNKKKVSNF